jgi:hypothetical protein
VNRRRSTAPAGHPGRGTHFFVDLDAKLFGGFSELADVL